MPHLRRWDNCSEGRYASRFPTLSERWKSSCPKSLNFPTKAKYQDTAFYCKKKRSKPIPLVMFSCFQLPVTSDPLRRCSVASKFLYLQSKRDAPDPSELYPEHGQFVDHRQLVI